MSPTSNFHFFFNLIKRTSSPKIYFSPPRSLFLHFTSRSLSLSPLALLTEAQPNSAFFPRLLHHRPRFPPSRRPIFAAIFSGAKRSSRNRHLEVGFSLLNDLKSQISQLNLCFLLDFNSICYEISFCTIFSDFET